MKKKKTLKIDEPFYVNHIQISFIKIVPVWGCKRLRFVTFNSGLGLELSVWEVVISYWKHSQRRNQCGQG